MKKSKKIERLSPPRANIKDRIYGIELERLSKARNKTEEKILTMIIDEFKRADIVLPIERCYFLKDAIGDEIKKLLVELGLPEKYICPRCGQEMKVKPKGVVCPCCGLKYVLILSC